MIVTLRQQMLPRLETANLILREVSLTDISNEYVAWLNDPQVTQFLELRFSHQTSERITQYVQHHLDDIESSMHFGVYILTENQEKLVGSTTVNVINRHHKTADISFVIGSSLARGRGFATESVHAVCAYLFSMERIHKVTGGHYQDNHGSRRVFQKNGFRLEGIKREQCIDMQGKRCDCPIYGLLHSEFAYQPALLGHEGYISIQQASNEH